MTKSSSPPSGKRLVRQEPATDRAWPTASPDSPDGAGNTERVRQVRADIERIKAIARAAKDRPASRPPRSENQTPETTPSEQNSIDVALAQAAPMFQRLTAEYRLDHSEKIDLLGRLSDLILFATEMDIVSGRPAYPPEPEQKLEDGAVNLYTDFVGSSASDREKLSELLKSAPESKIRLLADLFHIVVGAGAPETGNVSHIRQLALPKKAPVLWEDRTKKQETSKLNPARFTRNVYEVWLGQGLTRKYLRELDPNLYRALSVWETRHPEDRITELPTVSDLVDQTVDRLSAELTPDELRKLASTLQSRHQRAKNPLVR